MFTRAIVRPPAPNFFAGLTTAGLDKPDHDRALRQHEEYCAALEECGLCLMKLEPDERYPDSCFVEDTALSITALPSGRASAPTGATTHPPTQVVLTRPGAASRRGEVMDIRKTLNYAFPREGIHEIQAPGTLDGGDVCEAGNQFFIGLSQRTNEAGAQQLAELLTNLGYTSSIVNIRGIDGLLHLKSAIAYLGDNRLVVTESMADRQEFAGYDLVRINSGEEYAANCVRINDHVLIAAGYPSFEKKLRELEYQTIALKMSEFQKMDGGLSCLSLRF